MRLFLNNLYSASDVLPIHANMSWSTLRARLSCNLQGCRMGKGFRSTGAIRITARAAGRIGRLPKQRISQMTYRTHYWLFMRMVVGVLAFAFAQPAPAQISPAEMVAPDLQISGSTIYFTVQSSVTGHTYQLQYSDTMEPGEWSNLESLRTGDGNNLVIQTPYRAEVERRFYRILISDGFSFSGTPSTSVGSWGGITGSLLNQADVSQALAGSARGLRNLAITDLASSSLSVMQIGDSFSLGPYAGFDKVAPIRGSYRCGQLYGGGDSGVTTVVGDFLKTPGGSYHSITDGGNLTCGHVQRGVQGPADTMHYTLFPGTGTAQLQYSENGGAWTNIGSPINTTAISSIQIGNVPLPGAMQNVRCRVTANGGTVNGWIGQSASGPGVIVINFALSGNGADQAATVPEATFKAMVTSYGTRLVVSSYADHRFTGAPDTSFPKGSPTYGTNGPLDTLHAWSKAANPTIDWLFISAHRVDPSLQDAADATLDPLFTSLGIGQNTDARTKDGVEQCRQLALSRGEGFVDCYNMFSSFPEAFAAGMYSDKIHLSDKGVAYKTARVFESSGLSWIYGDGTYHSGVRIGNMWLGATSTRAQGPALAAYNYGVDGSALTLGYLLGSELRAGLPARPEQEGVSLYCHSSNVARIGMYSAAGTTPIIEFSSTTVGTNSGCNLQPIITEVGALGTSAKRFRGVVTGAVTSGYVTKTAAYTLTGADHTIHCTSGTFNVTLPLVFNGGTDDAYANKGREIVIVNSGTGTITLITKSDGTALQKIDATTTYTLGSGQKVRLQATGNLASGNYANWITL
jgi:hypothetical protein